MYATLVFTLPALQSRVTANGRVGATAAVYTAAILGAAWGWQGSPGWLVLLCYLLLVLRAHLHEPLLL